MDTFLCSKEWISEFTKGLNALGIVVFSFLFNGAQVNRFHFEEHLKWWWSKKRRKSFPFPTFTHKFTNLCRMKLRIWSDRIIGFCVWIKWREWIDDTSLKEFSIWISINSIHLERVHRIEPFFTTNALHSFLISMQSFLSLESFIPGGQMQLYDPAVFIQCDDFGQRKLPNLHSSISTQSSCSLSLKPAKHSHLKLPIVLIHCWWHLICILKFG